MKPIFAFLLMLSLLFLLNACSAESTDPGNPGGDPTAGLLKLGESYDSAARVELFSENTPAVGYHTIYILLSDSAAGTGVEDAHLTLTPMMEMQGMMHGAPVENPAGTTAQENGLFQTAAVFIMAGEWQLHLHFHNHHTGAYGEIMVPVNVAAANRVKPMTGGDSAQYFVTLIEPQHPVAGMNDIEICVHSQASMDSFPDVSHLTVGMEPTMPAMGHGSPNNEAPLATALGHYAGKVNFTMTGDWRIDLLLETGDGILGEVYFDLTVE